jgi:hypothetical protein
MSLYTTNKITIDFLQNLVSAPPLPPSLTRTVRHDRIISAFYLIGQKTGWIYVELSGFSNQNALAFRMLNKGDYIIIYTRKSDNSDIEYDDDEINIVSVDKINTDITLS